MSKKKTPWHFRKNQLKKHVYTYIVIILFCLMAVFLIVGNLDNVIQSLHMTRGQKEDLNVKYQSVVEQVEKSGTEEVFTQSDVYVWGRETKSFSLVTMELANMKESFIETDDLNECSKASLLIVCKADLTMEDIRILTTYHQLGMVLFFTDIPTEESLSSPSLKNLLGIKSYMGQQEKQGIRISQNVLFGTVEESKCDFSIRAVTLKNHTEVYSSALEEAQVDNESLAPMFWRYQQNMDSASVYIADSQLMESTVGYGLVSFLFGELNPVYMYPIVNAYCFAVAGMPYSEDFTSTYLQDTYERSSMDVENHIFFPEFRRCEDRYGIKTTWFTNEESKVRQLNDPLMSYYLEGIEEMNGEIGQLNTFSGRMAVESPFINNLNPWTTDSQWVLGRQLTLPYMNVERTDQIDTVFNHMGMVKGFGYNCLYVDANDFLYPPENGTAMDWIEFCQHLETILGVENQKMSWLDRVTVGEAIYRIQAFRVMSPNITYSNNQVTVQIDHFTGEAYFYLKLQEGQEITSTENAQWQHIGGNIYMITATSDYITIGFS